MSKTLKEKFLTGEKIVQPRISMASTREEGHQTIADTETRNHPTLKSIGDCRVFIEKELEGVNVRFFS